MAMKKNFFGIDIKKDADAMLMGAGAMFGALCIPKVGDFIQKGVDKVKSLIGRVL
ncbi:hypothetical protein [uncultured Sphaerochaeta sp.]|uniref:hypothetical protein n=1 Tax=uncultured Sphaerochaeta sp. TaxID=886478 RepID=UPI0029CA41AC|nr:hypothetical protein [uncultured Sphaerochaeta sp.]